MVSVSKSSYFAPEIETMDREKLEKLQIERIQWQVRRCYEGSEFYRERFDKIGIKPEDIKTLDDIRLIPPVHKDELRKEQIAHPPFGRYVVAPRKNWGELHPSTGTTGVPVNTIWSKRDRETLTQQAMRELWGFGVRPGHVIQNAYAYGLWVAGMITQYAANAMGCFILPIGAQMTDRQIDYFFNPGADFLCATPSFALFIAERMKERGIAPDDICLSIGGFGGEGGTEMPSLRKRLESRLGIDAYDWYGLAEIGPSSSAECEAKAGLHWVDDHLLPEIINPETMNPCAEGEIGVLVLTHLTREATPMLRYWTNDSARITKKECACGRTHARSVEGILGRADDLIIYKGENFYPSAVEKVIRTFNELGDEFKIRLTTDEKTGMDVVTVVAECNFEVSNLDELRKRLSGAFHDELQVTPRVEVVKMGTFERTMFKAKRIEDKREKA
jgi:phenylacetate-CoA ligase